LLEGDGLKRWTLPVELGREELAELLTAIKQEGLSLNTEVMVHGYLPLALSARCFTARAVDLPKDECGKVCIDYPVGIPVSSQEQQRLFTMNGIQTLSGDILDLMPALSEIEAIGVDAIRIAPSQVDMASIIEAYRAAIDGKLINGKRIETAPPSSAAYCDGYWYGEAGFKKAGLQQR
jgi:collagenase-like PrtC family protease